MRAKNYGNFMHDTFFAPNSMSISIIYIMQLVQNSTKRYQFRFVQRI